MVLKKTQQSDGGFEKGEDSDEHEAIQRCDEENQANSRILWKIRSNQVNYDESAEIRR